MRPLAFVALMASLLLAAAPARAQLLGLEQYLPPPSVDYAADVSMTADGDTVDGKIMRAAGKERRELTVEGELETIIIRLDRRLVWSLASDDKLYVEASLDEALGRVPGPSGKPREPQLTVTTLGDATVAGLHAAKKKLSGVDADGSPLAGTVWISDEGIVLRAESDIVDEDGKHHLLRMELKNLRIGPQNASLFEVPAGYKRVTRARTGWLAPPARARASSV
ncbi:MAG TPA: hypothetical protein VL244_04790 [Alphaproteobacteria bacterium]|nr:hypothetical protein [Alphaproteobacteria bacterium]